MARMPLGGAAATEAVIAVRIVGATVIRTDARLALTALALPAGGVTVRPTADRLGRARRAFGLAADIDPCAIDKGVVALQVGATPLVAREAVTAALGEPADPAAAGAPGRTADAGTADPLLTAGGALGRVLDGALARARADALLARLAGRRRGTLAGTGARLTGVVAGAAPGAALTRPGAVGPGVPAAVRGADSLQTKPGQQPTEDTPG
jgi:hypothetical protein